MLYICSYEFEELEYFLLSDFSWFNNNNTNNCYLLYNYYVLINYAYRLIQYLFPKEIHGVIKLIYFILSC